MSASACESPEIFSRMVTTVRATDDPELCLESVVVRLQTQSGLRQTAVLASRKTMTFRKLDGSPPRLAPTLAIVSAGKTQKTPYKTKSRLSVEDWFCTEAVSVELSLELLTPLRRKGRFQEISSMSMCRFPYAKWIRQIEQFRTRRYPTLVFNLP